MLLPRLKPSAILPFARSLSTTSHQCASHSHGNKNLFKEINQLAREGTWDAIDNSPKAFLFGRKKQEANAVYAKLIQPEDRFYQYGGQPYGPFIYLAVQLAKVVVLVTVLCKTYEFIVPEKYRLHYKYRPKHDKHHHDVAAAEHH